MSAGGSAGHKTKSTFEIRTYGHRWPDVLIDHLLHTYKHSLTSALWV